MVIVVDSSVLIDHLRGDARARTVLVDRANAGDEVWSVTVVRTEVLAGVRRGEEETTRALLASLKWQSVTVDIADRAGELARRFLRSYPGVDTVDYLIAAATELLGGALLTKNVKHFPMFADLKPAY